MTEISPIFKEIMKWIKIGGYKNSSDPTFIEMLDICKRSA